MKENSEISALFHLIDDPDQEVFDTVADKIIHYGKMIIPNLENLWENTIDEGLQERIELLIHRVHFQDLQVDFNRWAKEERPELFEGAVLVARYQFPDLSPEPMIKTLERIKRNIWLELNNYLTPLEQINVLNSMIYNFFGMKGSELSYDKKNLFFINQMLESKKGNPLSIGILYQVLCDLLDLPVMVVNIPRQFILAYFENYFEFAPPQLPADYRLQFYVDPVQGQIFTHQDVETYLKKLAIKPDIDYYRPLSNKRIIKVLLEELAKCFHQEKERYKKEELLSLAAILEENISKGLI